MNRARTFIAALGLATTSALYYSAVMIVPAENIVNVAYIPLKGDKPTICAGTTHGVIMGMKKTDEECAEIFKRELEENHAAVRRAITAPMGKQTEAAFADFVHNVGEPTFRNSSIRRLYNAGQFEAACERFRLYVYGPAVKGSKQDMREPAQLGSKEDLADGVKDGIRMNGKIDGKANCTIYANGCPGIPPRREAERAACLAGLKEGKQI